MRAERAIKALLDADSAVTTVVGSGAAARIYGGAAPQEAAAPLIVFTKQSAEREPVLDQVATRRVDGLIDVLVVARTYSQLKSLGEAVRVALNGKKGTFGGTTVLDIVIEAEGADQFEPQLDEFGQVWTFRVMHTE
jgi:hypothetical protein